MQTKLKQIMEQEGLETPKESVEFLEYYQKHTKKVEAFRKRLHTFSYVLCALGVSAFAFAAYKHFAVKQTSFSGR